MNRVVRMLRLDPVYAGPELLRSQTAMHEPLLIPNRLERAGTALHQHRQHVRAAEGSKSDLCPRRQIRSARIQGRVELGEHQYAEEVCLKEGVDVHEGA